jgi:hypothetical protein
MVSLNLRIKDFISINFGVKINKFRLIFVKTMFMMRR